ncbi:MULTISPECIES: hypothetical protein [unclassified Streptomyces]|uniref:hypothetical protein n=1 Tax=unclassified Streptomyces TaxID=2593676 RepID=UPI00081E0865|nr:MULTISPECIES: hypothetical protein [unclassified Streptomyces]SCD89129.1 hypothetical protein GA0115251_127519 [Streptomyces sp. TverLS-915]SCE66767.1 hypothetical protein GA0115257_100823 [Streptomyces sp. LcepLS]
MSGDVLVLRLPEGCASVEDLPEGSPELPLGPRADVLAALAGAVPEADLSDPAWGELEGPGWSMELNIGDTEPVDAVMLHVRGGGDDVLPVVLRIAEALGARLRPGGLGAHRGGRHVGVARLPGVPGSPDGGVERGVRRCGG